MAQKADTERSAERTGTRRTGNRSALITVVVDQLAPVVMLVVLCAALWLSTPTFAQTDNLLNIAKQTAVVAILAIGETFVIIAAGIDLSVGSVLALSGVGACMVLVRGCGVLTATLVGVAIGALCGVFNGVLTAKIRMPSFIVTLGMMGIARGLALVVTGGTPVYNLTDSFKYLGGGRLLGLPIPAVCMIIIAIVAAVVLKQTRLGRYTYAMGGNFEATRLAGIAVDRVTIWVFAIAGALSGFAGVIHAARIGIGSPTEGLNYELDAIAAAVIGGCSLMGGEGSVMGTMVGAFLMAVLRNGCNLLHIEEYWQRIAIGGVIILAVVYDHLRQRRSR